MKVKGIVIVAAMLAMFLSLGFGSGAVLAQEKEIVIGSVQDLSGPWSAAGKTLWPDGRTMPGTSTKSWAEWTASS